jgi:hydroxyacylglutathione hydrolase
LAIANSLRVYETEWAYCRQPQNKGLVQMKKLLTLILIVYCTLIVHAEPAKPAASVLNKTSWIHGSETCDGNTDGALDIYQHDSASFIVRQNKCLTFEAPFMFVLAGENKVLVLDTGALEDSEGFSFYKEAKDILSEHHSSKEIIVLHSHGHGDHYAGDDGFDGKAGVTLVGTSREALNDFVELENWSTESIDIDLGDRMLTVLLTPGHQEEAITVYDHKTKWLLTGDSLYSGVVYVKDWEQYKRSISRLSAFAKANEVSAILGTHIEMQNQPGGYYPIGSTYQPNESSLDLPVEDLFALNEALTNREPETLVFDRFIVEPMGTISKSISNLFRWIKK